MNNPYCISFSIFDGLLEGTITSISDKIHAISVFDVHLYNCLKNILTIPGL